MCPNLLLMLCILLIVSASQFFAAIFSLIVSIFPFSITLLIEILRKLRFSFSYLKFGVKFINIFFLAIDIFYWYSPIDCFGLQFEIDYPTERLYSPISK